MNDRELTVRRWLTKATHDLRTARTMHAEDDPPADVICFHSQQCAEKSVKAFLVSIDAEFPKTHDLPRLLALCVDHEPSFSVLEDDARCLTDYAVEPRYIDDWRDIPVAEAAEAVTRASRVLGFVLATLGIGEGDV